jgi:uncharacterized membrane protein YphA (DoxX/SURF4 family)
MEGGNIFKLSISQFIVRLLLGGIFIYASLDKIAFPGEFAKIVQSYNILPDFLVKITALVLPWIELIFGIFLVIGLFVKKSAIILTSLLFIFLIAFGIQATKGPIEDCGCFGKMPFLSSSNTIILMIRDLVFISLGLMIVLVENQMKSTKRINPVE